METATLDAVPAPARRLPGADLVGWWIVAGLVGALLTVPFGSLTTWLVTNANSDNRGQWATILGGSATVVGLIAAGIAAALQWQGMRPYLPQLKPLVWIVVTLLGTLGGQVIGSIWNILLQQMWINWNVSSPQFWIGTLLGGVVVANVSGALLGLVQGAVLRHGRAAANWTRVRAGVGALVALGQLPILLISTILGVSTMGSSCLTAILGTLVGVGAAALLGLAMRGLIGHMLNPAIQPDPSPNPQA